MTRHVSNANASEGGTYYMYCGRYTDILTYVVQLLVGAAAGYVDEPPSPIWIEERIIIDAPFRQDGNE